MKIIEKEGPLLCDAEVMEHISSVKSSVTTLQNVQTICVELLAYLRERPAGNVECPQTSEGISAFVKGIREIGLTLEKAEILQLVNSAPDNWPVLFCLIEEADIRYSEDQLSQLLELSQQYLGVERIPQ